MRTTFFLVVGALFLAASSSMPQLLGAKPSLGLASIQAMAALAGALGASCGLLSWLANAMEVDFRL